MRQDNRWWLILVPTLLISLSGCDANRSFSESSLIDNSRLMEMWGTYTHCYRSEDLDAMRADAQHLSRSVHSNDEVSSDDPRSPESDYPIDVEPTRRLSVDPAAMAAACALHTGQAAQATGRHDVAREMFQTVMTSFPQARYRYYVTQARLGLKRLDAASHTTPSTHTMSGGPT